MASVGTSVGMRVARFDCHACMYAVAFFNFDAAQAVDGGGAERARAFAHDHAAGEVLDAAVLVEGGQVGVLVERVERLRRRGGADKLDAGECGAAVVDLDMYQVLEP